MQWILSLEFNHFSIPRPDLNIFLDVPHHFTAKKLSGSRTGDDRSYLKGTRDIHEESLDFQSRVREIYLRVSRSDERLEVIDCSNEKGDMLPPEDIFSRVTQLLTKRNLIK
jgi:dTMP kinase